MQIQQRVLRLAAAVGVSLFLVGGALGPAYATDHASRDDAATHQSNGAGKGQSDHSDGNASTTGDSTEPQPESTADQNDGGANAGECDQSADSTQSNTTSDSTDTTGSSDTQTSDSTRPDSTQSSSTQPSDTNNYCSTRDGSPSMNGNGDGKATGKPCAGCVGKADNKNPKGQYPDGSDANNGYECDGNNGIGKSNPAHTGCTSQTPGGGKTDECVDPDGCQSPCVDPATCQPPSCPADATECQAPGTPEGVLGTEAAGTANRAAADVAPASSGLLPETGAGRYGIPIAAGLLLLGAGGALLLRRRSQAGR